MLFVDKYQGYYKIVYMRNGKDPWYMNALRLKTHGLVDFPDEVFYQRDLAVNRARAIAERMNLHFGTEETGIRVKEWDHGKTPIENIVVTTKTPNVTSAEYDNVPNTEGNNWTKLKKEN